MKSNWFISSKDSVSPGTVSFGALLVPRKNQECYAISGKRILFCSIILLNKILEQVEHIHKLHKQGFNFYVSMKK